MFPVFCKGPDLLPSRTSLTFVFLNFIFLFVFLCIFTGVGTAEEAVAAGDDVRGVGGAFIRLSVFCTLLQLLLNVVFVSAVSVDDLVACIIVAGGGDFVLRYLPFFVLIPIRFFDSLGILNK